MGLERFGAETVGMPKYTEPIADYQMLANDLVVRAFSKGAMPVVRLATAAALGACTATGSGVGKTLEQDSFAVEAIDGVAPVVGDLILVQDQAEEIDNGLYRITVVGDAVDAQQTLVRDTEYDATADAVLGALFFVEEGTANGDTIVHISAAPAILDTNDWDFTAGIYASITITLPSVAEAKGKLFSILTMAATPTLTVTVSDGDDSEDWSGDYTFMAAGHSGLFYSDGKKWTALFGGIGVLSTKTVLTSAQIKALAGTPITLVPALGATKLIEFLSATLMLDYGGSDAFVESTDDLVIGYVNESGVVVSAVIDSTNFIDATEDMFTRGIPVVDAIVTGAASLNQPLVIFNNSGDFTGNGSNDNTMTVWTLFRVIETG